MGKEIYCLNYTIATHLLYHVYVFCNDAMDVNYLISFHLVININIELMLYGPIKYSSLNRRVNKVSQRFHNHEGGPY